jgi:serine protease Do
MARLFQVFALIMGCFALCARAQADDATETPQQLYDRARQSIVVVKYTLSTELGRHELIVPGVVVSADGLVMIPMAAVNENWPDSQLKEFKIVVPKIDADEEELDAVFQGRDERSEVAFVRTKEPQKWTPIHFEEEELKIGDPIYSVGILSKAAGYRAYFMRAMFSADIISRNKQILVGDGGLATTGSPVFAADGKAIGYVNYQPPFPMWLNDANPLVPLVSPPKFVTPTSEIAQSLADPPTADHHIQLAWIGAMELNGLKKDEAEYFGLVNQPAVQIGGVAPNGPAEKAGLKQGDIIVKLNGKSLERTDDPDDLPMLMHQKLLRLKPGTDITLTVLSTKGQPTKDVHVILELRPATPNEAKRYWAEDLGFGVRELAFQDRYALKLKPDGKGLYVAVVKPESSAATGGLKLGDLVTQLNGQPVTDLESFKTAYEAFRKDQPRVAVVMVALRDGREETIRIEPPQ